jgi:hypothetical protein
MEPREALKGAGDRGRGCAVVACCTVGGKDKERSEVGVESSTAAVVPGG